MDLSGFHCMNIAYIKDRNNAHSQLIEQQCLLKDVLRHAFAYLFKSIHLVVLSLYLLLYRALFTCVILTI